MVKKIILACSIFKLELEHLKKIKCIDIPIYFLDSMLHMHPEKLELYLDEKIDQFKDFEIFLIYGDCHARIIDCNFMPNITKSEGINCCEIILGKEKYHKLRKEGAFIILPEWAEKWKEVFLDQLGFKNQTTTALFMNDMHKKISFINTGVQEIPHQLLQDISTYFQLPFEVLNCDLEELHKQLKCFIDK